MASDIPIFREVGGDGAKFFSLNDPLSLVEVVKEMVDLTDLERNELAQKIKVITWKESAERVVDLIKGKQREKSLLS